MSDWFTVDKIDEDTYIVSEYHHWEETHCYLINGGERSLLIDTGLGICDISEQVKKLTDKPVAAVATHVHWDHIGGHRYYPDFYAHKKELHWLNGKFPLTVDTVKQMISDRCDLPEDYDIDAYTIFQGAPSKLLKDGDGISLGGREIQVIHTPGHSPGHMCFYEKKNGFLFSGDLVYQGTLFANYASTDPEAYLSSLEKVSRLPVKRILPGHHSLSVKPEILFRMLSEFRDLYSEGKLHHGSGKYDYGDWSVWM